MAGLPSVVFGIVALGPAVLALLLPETSQSALPDDVMDAEKLDAPPEEQPQDDHRNEEVPRITVSITKHKVTQ